MFLPDQLSYVLLVPFQIRSSVGKNKRRKSECNLSIPLVSFIVMVNLYMIIFDHVLVNTDNEGEILSELS